jgi:2-amino-4-hydroxy-6-hydroxymethyldihydropteridine diphosphokinase
MTKHHIYYLNIGSNIEPDINLPKTINLLAKHGEVKAISNAWESRSIGANGPNFLNACIIFYTPLSLKEFKEKVIKYIETSLGRQRSNDKSAPRTIDIDIIMADNEPLNLERWNNPFVVIPMAELMPKLIHPTKHQELTLVADRMRSQTWIVKRPNIF